MNNNLIRKTVLLALIIAVLTLFKTELIIEQPSACIPQLAVGNPAAIYCTDIMGYEYKIAADVDGGERGICILPNEQKCNQWDFYAGLCGQDYNYCAQQGYHTETRMDGQDPFASRYTVCVSPESQMLGSVAQLSNLNARVVITDTEVCPEVDTSSHPPASISQDMTPTAPSSFDWRNHLGYNWLTGVKDQDCGDCWAFAAIGVTEAHHNIVADNPRLDLNLAEQNLVSCSDAGSCSGGSSYLALRYIQSNGIVDENCFPYMGADSSCILCSGWQNRLTYVDEVYGFVPTRDTIRQSVVDYGPMYVSMGVNLDYGGYWDGNNIYRCSNDSQNGQTGSNHAVVIVGYNDAGGYWIVRNSWGSGWNGDGYFKVGYDECNIDRTYASYTYLVPPTQASGVHPDGWTGPYTNDSTPRFQWYAASDSGSGMAGYYVAVDDWTPEGGFDNDWWVGNVTAYTVPEAQSDGQHIFAVTSKDRFGNINPNNTNQQGDAPYYTFYVDTHAPSSAVSALAAKQQQMKFTVKWSGSDVTSGVANYDVQYRLGTSGTWVTWISASSATSAVFQAQQEGTYYFRSRARDRAGNVESWPSGNGDAYTYVPMIKVYLPLLLKNYTYTPVEPYQPIGEIIMPSDDIYDVRGVEEKDGYVYVLTREGYFYTYNVSNLPIRTSFTTYDLPVSTLRLSNGNGLLRNGNYLYAFGYGGLTVLSLQNPASPSVVMSRDDFTVYNLIQYNDYLIAPGYQRVGVYAISNPADPILLSSYYAANRYFFSAAVYNNTLYTSDFEMFPGPTYAYGFRVFDFSDPSALAIVRFISRDSAAYHLRVVGDALIECDTSFVGIWDLANPTNPTFLMSQFAQARACALDYRNNLVTNGKVFRLDGNTLENIANFTPEYGQVSGFPHGAVVTSDFVFIAQSPRVLIIKIGPNPDFQPFAEYHPSNYGGSPLDDGLVYSDTFSLPITP